MNNQLVNVIKSFYKEKNRKFSGILHTMILIGTCLGEKMQLSVQQKLLTVLGSKQESLLKSCRIYRMATVSKLVLKDEKKS